MVAALVVFAEVGTSEAPTAPAERSTCLADAIETFNAQAREDPVGKEQPPLTEEELVAAIRARDHENEASVSDQLCSTLKQIVETRKLPSNVKLTATTGWSPGGDLYFDVWWVRLTMERDDGSTSSFPIRQRIIRSRPYNQVFQHEVLQSEAGIHYMKLDPGKLGGNLELPLVVGERIREEQVEVGALLRRFRSEIEALRDRLRRIEQRLGEIEKTHP